MTWIQDRWHLLRFNRLDFERKYVVDQVLSQKPRSRVVLTRRRGDRRQTIMKLSERAAANPLEVQCLRSLRHPGIISYLGHGFTRDCRQWIETEYVDGVPLSAWLDSRPSSEDTELSATRILLQLLSVVQYVHCCGWLHGDLSPQNILVVPAKWSVVLVDFEHARMLEAANSTVLPRKHSPAFASPHEAAGGVTTEACEQFALGKLGLMMLGLFESETQSKLKAILSRAASARMEDRYPTLQAIVNDVENSVRKPQMQWNQ
ncbi:MAG: protein kinase [Planctomycetota bacterium]